jgi:DegV family protein with EDD domain
MVAIVTDSAANLPKDHARELGIAIVPMYLNLGDEVYRDGQDLTPGDFYERLAAGAGPPTTATPSYGDYLEAFERTGQGEIVCVTVTGGLSSSHQQATMAAERFSGRVEVVDSRSASMGEGFVALEAARRAADGASLEEAASRARDVAEAARLIAVVDTFAYLKRSGRVTKLQAYAATMLDIKPVFRFDRGESSPVARPRTRKRALARLVEEALGEIGERLVHLAAVHAAAEDDAEWVANEVGSRSKIVESFVVEVTPVIGAHTGPGLVGAAFFCE